MLPKRFIERKSVLNTSSRNRDTDKEKCPRRKPECGDDCGEHSTLFEETMKVVLLGMVLWAGVTFGSSVAPYPLNILVTNDILHPPPMYDFPFPSQEMLRKIPPVKVKHTNRSIEISKMSVDMMKRLEENIFASQVSPKSGSPARGLLVNGYPSDDALHYEKSSMVITKASQNLVVTRCERYGLPIDECASFISTLNLAESEYGAECATLERFTCGTQKKSSRYRTFDGSCNNPVRSSWGQALTGYRRLLHPRYADGIEEPRRGVNHKQLPSARLVSKKLVSEIDKPDQSRTLALAVWTQFIHHDMVHTPVRKMVHSDHPIRCCDNMGQNLAPRYRHPHCMPIEVPSDDPYFSPKYVSCMEYTRSVTTYRGDCTFGAAEQMNQASHFLDGSHIYGSNSRDAVALRENHGGLLKTQNLDSGEFLPNLAKSEGKCLFDGADGTCFTSGDARANMHPWLGTLHAVFVREHNRIARQLASLNPSLSSDKLYHEARRIVVAELQHITYKHWLPALTGKSFDQLYESYDVGYNSDTNPSVTNAFATAAFHFVNSILDGDVTVKDVNGNVTTLELMRHFYKLDVLTGDGVVEGVARGMVSESSQGLDFYYDDDFSEHWLGGMDSLAVDIQRGRDHGLPGYAQYRTPCGLPQLTSFQQLGALMSPENVDKLSKIYEHVNDIDLVVGAMAETPLPGSMIGPTFTCLIKEQMWRTSTGDRYFYAHTDEAGSFTKRQLAELKRATLARLLCDNVPGIRAVQRDVFAPPSTSNPEVPCDEIKKVNLAAWQDPSQQPDIITKTQQNVNKWIKDKVTK